MYGNEYGNRPMKRSHSPDSSFDNQQNNNFRGGYRGGYHGHHGGFHKRHRGDNNFHNQPLTLEEKIARLGDTGFNIKEIGNVAKDVADDIANKGGDEEKIKERYDLISSKICKCIISFPSKLPTYSTLVALISVKHYQISSQILQTLYASYPVYLENQKWKEAILIIQTLSHLVNCKMIQPSALLSQFEVLLEVTFEDNIPQARSDYYVYTVLSSLPYVASELASVKESNPDNQSFDQIMNTLETYLMKRSKDHLNVTRVWLSNDSTTQMDYLDSLWVQTKNFRANNWIETYSARPYNEKEHQDVLQTILVPQGAPAIQVPSHLPHYIYPEPKIVFRLFEDDVAEGEKAIPGRDKIERVCIENHIRNIIDEIPTDPRDCARHLRYMYGNDKLPLKHILIETILGELFTLPKPKHPEIFYHSLLYEFTKIFNRPEEAKFSYDVILNEAVKILFDNLDTMNITCFNRFIEWISFHLNNIGFVFPWQSWTDATFKERESPKAVFVFEVLDRCVRFSFHKKIYACVSTNLSNLMPPEVGVKYQPVFADHPKAKELADTVKKLIVEKADLKLISETLNLQIEGIEVGEDFVFNEEKHMDKLLKIDIFTAVILHIASKSLTHLSSAIGKFRNVFKALMKVEDGQVQLLRTMHSCLETHPQLQVILVDKLLKAELIQAKEVCKWIFSESMTPHQLKSYTWELLNNTIHRTSQLVRKLMKSRDDLETAKVEKDNDTENGEGDIEMKQEDVKAELDEKIEKMQATYEELIFLVYEMFAEILGNHIRKCEIANTSYMDNWFRWIVGRMQQVYYSHYDSMHSHYFKIKSIIDCTPSIGNAIVNLSQQ